MRQRWNSAASRLLVGVVLANVFVYALAGYALHESRLQYEHDAEVTRQNLVHSLASNVAGTLDRMDVGLSFIASLVERELVDGQIRGDTLNDYLARQKPAIRDVRNLWVMDAKGATRWGTNLPPGGPVDV